MPIRNANEAVLSYCPDQDDPIQVIGYGFTSSAGNAGGTTLIDTAGIAESGAADTYNGRYWVTMLAGTNKGLSKRIIDDDGAGTLTLEGNGFPNQIAITQRYMIWKSSEALIVVDASGAATNIVDAIRDEIDAQDEYWDYYYVTPISGARAGEIKVVSAFAGGTGTFTTGAFTGALAAGDTCLLRRFLEANNVNVSYSEPYIEPFGRRLNFSRGIGRTGARAATITFDVPMQGTGAITTIQTAAGEYARSANISGLLQAVGLVESIGRRTDIDDVGAAGTTTSLLVDTATHEYFDIGDAIQWAGNVAWITAKTDGAGAADTLTVTPALPLAPKNNDAIYAGRTYKIDTDAQRKGVTLYWERDGLRETFFQCKGNVEFVPGDSGAIVARFNLQATHYVREIEDEQCNPQAAYATQEYILGEARRVYVDGTQTDVKAVTFTPGSVAVAKNTSGRYGLNGSSEFQHVDSNAGGTLTVMLEDTDDGMTAEEHWQTQESLDIAIAYGHAGNCVAFRMPAAYLRAAPHPQVQEGLIANTYDMHAGDAGVATDPADGIVDVPNWSITIF